MRRLYVVHLISALVDGSYIPKFYKKKMPTVWNLHLLPVLVQDVRTWPCGTPFTITH